MMDLIRHPSPSLGIATFEELDKLFDNIWKKTSMPSVDIYSEDDNHMVIEMHAPGFSENDLTINVRNGVLEIRGESKSALDNKDKKRSYLMRESYASFARRVVLPEAANADNISAELEKGVLRVNVPVERSEAKRIKISNKSQPIKHIDKSNK